MTATPEADFTPWDVDLRLRRHSWTPVQFIFGALNLTGYTAPVFRWGQSIQSGDPDGSVTGFLTPGADSTITVTLDTSFWSSLGFLVGGDFELALTTPAGQPVALAAGRFRVEGSFLP